MSKIRVGLYGTNGHQHLAMQTLAKGNLGLCTATAGFPPGALIDELRNPSVREYITLDDMLADDSIDLISMCSPHRADQAAEAIRALEAGKHVYAEKPCAMHEADLDAILQTAARTGKLFHEMAPTAFAQPYLTMRNLVAAGTLGTIVQVYAQKSYPYHDRRPQDEAVDGGMLLQVGVHATRFIEHVAGVKIKDLHFIETQLGNPKPGDIRMAASLMGTLENGGVVSIVCNYLKPPCFKPWGNEHLRIFGTKGMLESIDGGTKTHLVLNDQDCGPLDVQDDDLLYLDLVLAEIAGKGAMPLSLEDEIHPLRVLLRARDVARANNKNHEALTSCDGVQR